MNTFEFDGVGIGDLFFGGRMIGEKGRTETHEQLEKRCWRTKINRNESGQCIIGRMALHHGLESAAKRIQMPVKGMKGKTYIDFIKQGILPREDFLLTTHDGKPIMVEDVQSRTLFVPSDGRRGGKKRVDRIFPVVSEWKFHATLIVFDERISEEVLLQHLTEVGQYIGMGALRVENGGIAGRFSVEKFKMLQQAKAA